MAVNGRLDVNVALNRPSYMVSMWNAPPLYYPPSLANDGNHDTVLFDGNEKCAHTELETNPWWAVDLLVSLFVAGVKFTNRNGAGTSANVNHCIAVKIAVSRYERIIIIIILY